MADEVAEGARSAYEPTTAEAAAYFERMIAGLREIAQPYRELAMLRYVLDVARKEAAARGMQPPP